MVLIVYRYVDIIRVPPVRGGFRYTLDTFGISCSTLRGGILDGSILAA